MKLWFDLMDAFLARMILITLGTVLVGIAGAVVTMVTESGLAFALTVLACLLVFGLGGMHALHEMDREGKAALDRIGRGGKP